MTHLDPSSVSPPCASHVSASWLCALLWPFWLPDPRPCEADKDADPKGLEKLAPAASFMASFFALVLLADSVLASRVLCSRPPSCTIVVKTRLGCRGGGSCQHGISYKRGGAE